MRCPVCGHENNDRATRCATCGHVLPSVRQSREERETQAVAHAVHDTLPRKRVTDTAEDAGDTARRTYDPSASSSASPVPQIHAHPHPRRALRGATQRMRAVWKNIAGFVSAHQRVLGVCALAVVAAALVGGWFVLSLRNAPTYPQIEQDIAQALPEFSYQGGLYGPDATLPLSAVSVTKRSATHVPADAQALPGIGAGAYAVEVEATYEDDAVRVVRNVSVTYVRTDDSWIMTGGITERDTSYWARAGADENKILANLDTILDAATVADKDVSLRELYADGTFSLAGSSFTENPEHDTALDDITISCAKDEEFYSLRGTVVARLAFESGVWSLRSAEADAASTQRDFSPLIGTWTGELSSTQSSGSSCYGCREHPLTLAIEQIGTEQDGVAQVKGSVSGLVHAHAELEEEAPGNEGDILLENETLRGGLGLSDNGTLHMECATLDQPQLSIDVSVDFGTDYDSSAVVGRVSSTYSYTETVFWFIPRETTARFTDTYAMTRV